MMSFERAYRLPLLWGLTTVLALSSGCKSTGSKVKVGGVGPLSGWDKLALKAVVQLKFYNEEGKPGFGSGGLFKNPDDGRIIFITNAHVAGPFAVPPKPLTILSNGTNLLKVDSTLRYKVTMNMAPAGTAGTTAFAETDFASVLVDQTLFTDDAKKIESLTMSTKPVARGDAIGFAGYGQNDDQTSGIQPVDPAAPAELRYGTNVVEDLTGPQRIIVAYNPKILAPREEKKQCFSVICSDYRRSQGKPVKIDGATPGQGDSGSMVVAAEDKAVVGMVSQGGQAFAGGSRPETIVSYTINVHSSKAGAFFKSELAKVGIAFEPGSYDAQNQPIKAKFVGRANKLSTTSLAALPPGNIINNETGETIFEGTIDGAGDAATAADAGASDAKGDSADASSPSDADSSSKSSSGEPGVDTHGR